ncbi:LuxR C-terminal-related transcriptional regulator [Allohahella marinimesophila]|uniref:LuxR C-terminal-related transcriptional regulator n=1 Tax=Allohahella marinimesophila TaxID=1054972 RepID=A0ABP7PEL8_9GAMM
MFILPTKLLPPQLPARLVSRPRLTALFAQQALPRFTGFFAPAGYGKTTLVQQILAEHLDTDSKAQLAWYAVDATDNFFSGFWNYIWATTFGRETKLDDSIPGEAAFEAPSPQWLDESQPEQIAAAYIQAVHSLLNKRQAAQQGGQIFLVLDDLHLVQRPAILRSIAYLIDFAPPGLHVLATSRSEPDMPLARWKIKQYATLIHAADLVFTSEEIGYWFGDSFEPDELANATGGWAAALRLIDSGEARMRSRTGSQPDRKALPSTLNQDEVDVYVAQEVLVELPEDLLQFVLDVAHFQQFTLDLCDLVRDEDNTRECLNELLRRRLFIIELDEQAQWYRFHDLFRNGALYLLRNEYPARYENLLQKTVAALIDSDCFLEAVQYLFLRERWAQAADELERVGNHILRQGYHQLVLSWLQDLPMEIEATRPRLTLMRAWCLFFDNRFAAVTDILDQMAIAFPALFDADQTATGEDSQLRPELHLLAAYVDRFSGDYAQARHKTTAALKELQHIDVPMKSLAYFGLANDSYIASDLDNAAVELRKATLEAKVEQRYSTFLSSIGLLVWIYSIRGAGEDALALRKSAVEWITSFHRNERDPNVVSCWLNSGLVLTHLAAGNILQAKAALSPMLEFVADAEAQQQIFTWYVQARLHLVERKYREATALLHQACRVLESASEDTQALAPPLTALLNKVHLFRMRYEHAESASMGSALMDLPDKQWSENNAHILTQVETRLAYAEWQLLRCEYDGEAHSEQALEAATALITLVTPTELHYHQTAAHLLMALTAKRAGRDPLLVRDHVVAAIRLATRFKLVSCALLFADQVRQLLSELSDSVTSGLDRAFINQWIQHLGSWLEQAPSALADSASTAPTEARQTTPVSAPELQSSSAAEDMGASSLLSQREIEVLELINKGLPNKLIANDLNLAPATIKAHIRNIYGKLGAGRRTEALAIARSRGLLKS